MEERATLSLLHSILHVEHDLPLAGNRGIECRSGGATSDYTVVFSFVNSVTNCGTASTAVGSVSLGPNPNQCTENLTGVTNAQYLTVTLSNVHDVTNHADTISVTMGLLVGDVNASGRVDSGDVFSVRQHTGQAANDTEPNFRNDVNTNGRIDSGDVFAVRQQTGTGLPSPP